MRKTIRLTVLALFLAPTLAQAAATQWMSDTAKFAMVTGRLQVPAATCTASGVPSPCCTGSGTGTNCGVYKLALVTNSTTNTAATTGAWDSANTNCTAAGRPYTCCSGSGAGTCVAANTAEVGASGSYSAGGATLTTWAATTSSNDVCINFSTPVSFTTATITARAAVIYDDTTKIVVSSHCLDGQTSSCAADTTSNGGTFTVNLPAAGLFCLNN